MTSTIFPWADFAGKDGGDLARWVWMIVADGSVASPPLIVPPYFSQRVNKSARRCDKDVAIVVARFSAAGLGLLAFSISVTAGVFAQNPVEITLSRSIFALFTFCFLGLLLGAAAQRVVDEHEKKRVGEIREQYREDSTVMEGGEPVTVPAASSGQLNDA